MSPSKYLDSRILKVDGTKKSLVSLLRMESQKLHGQPRKPSSQQQARRATGWSTNRRKPRVTGHWRIGSEPARIYRSKRGGRKEKAKKNQSSKSKFYNASFKDIPIQKASSSPTKFRTNSIYSRPEDFSLNIAHRPEVRVRDHRKRKGRAVRSS